MYKSDKPHISRKYYPGSRRGYWSVSPVPKRWSLLRPEQQVRWNAANNFKEKLTERESLKLAAQEYINKYGTEGLKL